MTAFVFGLRELIGLRKAIPNFGELGLISHPATLPTSTAPQNARRGPGGPLLGTAYNFWYSYFRSDSLREGDLVWADGRGDRSDDRTCKGKRPTEDRLSTGDGVANRAEANAPR